MIREELEEAEVYWERKNNGILDESDETKKCNKPGCKYYDKNPDDYFTLRCFYCCYYNKAAFA